MNAQSRVNANYQKEKRKEANRIVHSKLKTEFVPETRKHTIREEE